jgi:hypothetical protein
LSGSTSTCCSAGSSGSGWTTGSGTPPASTRNRDRLLAGEVASRFLATILAQPKVRTLLSTEHFSIDGTLLEAWASPKRFRPKDGSGAPPDAGRNGEQDFRG